MDLFKDFVIHGLFLFFDENKISSIGACLLQTSKNIV